MDMSKSKQDLVNSAVSEINFHRSSFSFFAVSGDRALPYLSRGFVRLSSLAPLAVRSDFGEEWRVVGYGREVYRILGVIIGG